MSYASHQKHGRAARPRVRVGILTSSDSRDLDTDESGQAIEAILGREHDVVGRLVARDSITLLRRAANDLVRRGADVLVVTGGTGLGPRDVAPEAFEPWFRPPLPGFGERLRALSQGKIGSGAMLSRASAGVVHRGGRRVLVFLCPGSPDAAKLAAKRLILPELSHAVAVLQGVRPHA